MHTPADRILFQPENPRPRRDPGAGGRVGISRQAALQHLERLVADGLVDHLDERRGVGRPRRIWSLTQAAQARFPDTHAQLTLEMLDAVRAEFGEDGLERMILRREHGDGDGLRQAMARGDRAGGPRRAAGRNFGRRRATWPLVARPWRGLPPRGEPLPDLRGGGRLPGICRAELQVFREVLGPGAVVERTDHILAGAVGGHPGLRPSRRPGLPWRRRPPVWRRELRRPGCWY